MDAGLTGIAALEAEMRDRLAAKNAEIERLREVLEWVSYNYSNQDMNHVDFRVEAKIRSDKALGRQR